MKLTPVKAKVTAEKAIIKQGSLVEVADTGNDLFLVLKSNGQKIPSQWTLWLKRSEIQIQPA